MKIVASMVEKEPDGSHIQTLRFDCALARRVKERSGENG